jgi:PAS domain S-box-containing protein
MTQTSASSGASSKNEVVAGEQAAQNLRILVVDDNLAVRRGIRSLLAHHQGFVVCGEAADGLDAIEKANQLRPDVVVMDVTMPRMDGLQASRAILQDLPGTRIVIVSQNDPEIVREQASEVAAHGFVSKADLAQQLVSMIEFVSDKGRRAQASCEQVEETRMASAETAPVLAPNSSEAAVVEPDFLSRQTDALLAAIVSSSDDAIISKNLDGIITSWNRSAARMFGYSADEAVGKHITLIIPRERWPEEDHIIGRLRHGEKVDHFETVRCRKDGSTVELALTISPVRDRTGRVIGASKVARDITERKRAQEREQRIIAEAVAANAKFRAVFEQTTVFAGVMTKDGVLIEANRLSLEACGYKAEEVLGRPFWETPWWRNSAEAREKIRAATPRVAQGVPYREMLLYSWADGSEHPVDFALYPIVSDAGEVLFLHPTGVDITETKQVEERYRKLSESLDGQVRVRTRELEARNAEMQKQSEQLRQLSRRLLRAQDDERRYVARELHDSAGQTLTVLGLAVEQLLARSESSFPVLREDVDAVCELVKQLQREVRTTSYLLHPPLLDERGLYSALTWYVQGLAERSGVKIELDIAKNFGRLPSEMELAIFRLIQEGLTNIHRHSGSKTARIGVSRDADCVKVVIADEGKGMAPERLAEIQSGGSGVGIRGMRERFRQFQGVFSINSDPSGTDIVVTVPVPREPRPR